MRRGRGFNATEVANLRSWGYEPRPDEVEPAPAVGVATYGRPILEEFPELAVLAHGTTRGRYEAILRQLQGQQQVLQQPLSRYEQMVGMLGRRRT